MPNTRAIAASHLVVVAALVLGLAGCTPTSGSTEEVGDMSDTSSGSEETTENADFVTVSGTGSYLIGTEIPLGGFQLKGEPDEQPAGCTWQILDADGGVTFENTGQYVFLTDIREAVTFVTTGCPDWEQFE